MPVTRVVADTASVTPRPQKERHTANLRVWIDQDLCTGDGLCIDICPDVFVQLEDGIAYVREGDVVLNDPGSSQGLAHVAEKNEAAVLNAAMDCPGECIFIEPRRQGPESGD